MFWKKKEVALTYEQELQTTIQHLRSWVEFIQTEIAEEADNVEIADLGDMRVSEAKQLISSFHETLAFLEPLQ